jgi:PilZ domain-containing protein
MLLTAEQYEQIVRQLRSEQPRARSSERRGSPRAGLRAQVRVIPCRTSDEASLLTAWVRDISADGIGLLLPQRLPAGTYLVLTLPTATRKSATLDLLFLAVRCDPLPNGQFSVGARFQRLITAEDMK